MPRTSRVASHACSFVALALALGATPASADLSVGVSWSNFHEERWRNMVRMSLLAQEWDGCISHDDAKDQRAEDSRSPK